MHNVYNVMGQAYDQHLNMILGNVEETITVVEYDEDTCEEHVKVILLIVVKVDVPCFKLI